MVLGPHCTCSYSLRVCLYALLHCHPCPARLAFIQLEKETRSPLVVLVDPVRNHLCFFLHSHRLVEPGVRRPTPNGGSFDIVKPSLLPALQDHKIALYLPLLRLRCLHRGIRPPLPLDREVRGLQKPLQFLLLPVHDLWHPGRLPGRYYRFFP